MNIRAPFINEHSRLRSGWRILIFAFLLMVFINATDVALYLVQRNVGGSFSGPDALVAIINRVFLLLAALAAGYFCTRIIEGLPWRALGLALHQGWHRDLILGSAIGILSLSLAVLIGLAIGGLRFSLTGSGMFWSMVKSVGGSAVVFAIAALAEEAIFRGYPLQTLARAKLIWLGVLLNFVFFAIVHLGNPHVVPGFTFINTALAGVWLSIAFIRTRSLWFPLAVHWGWNWALGSLFGLPVSGLKLVSHPALQSSDLGPAWVTGGSYGIEGGAACTVALVISCLFVWRTRLVSATPEQMKLTSEELPATSPSAPITQNQ